MLVISQRDAATPAYLGSLGGSKQIGGQGKLVWAVSCGFKGYFFNKIYQWKGTLMELKLKKGKYLLKYPNPLFIRDIWSWKLSA